MVEGLTEQGVKAIDRQLERPLLPSAPAAGATAPSPSPSHGTGQLLGVLRTLGAGNVARMGRKED